MRSLKNPLSMARSFQSHTRATICDSGL